MVRYIAFEGIDGSGKTTQVNVLVSRLKEKGIKAITYKYTNKNNFFGRIISKLYTRKRSSENINSILDIFKSRFLQEFLYAQSARLNYRQIRSDLPKSLEGLVICDRCTLTAYASHFSKLPEWYLNLLEPKLIPDIIFLLDMSAETAMERTKGRTCVNSDECLSYEQNQRNIYLSFANNHCPYHFRQSKFIIIKGKQPVEKVAMDVFNELESLLFK